MSATAPVLTDAEVRVFGCMIEGSQVAPEHYPMSLEHIVASCNRKDGRNPVTRFSLSEVEDALASLRSRGLTAFSSGSDQQLLYMHRAGRSGLNLSTAQMAVMSVLLLRGPQSAVRLQAHSARQFTFPDVDAVMTVLESMRTADRPYVEAVHDDASGDGTRYRHTFTVYGDQAFEDAASASKEGDITISREQLRSMQQELNTLRNTVQALQAELIAMREEFGDD